MAARLPLPNTKCAWMHVVSLFRIQIETNAGFETGELGNFAITRFVQNSAGPEQGD
jgi:hypothetical protein